MNIEAPEDNRAIQEGIPEEDRLQRIVMATKFLDSVLLPLLGLKNIDIDAFDKLLSDFKENNPGLGSDFEPHHIWGIAYKRSTIKDQNTRLSGGRLSGNQLAVERALDLLTDYEQNREESTSLFESGVQLWMEFKKRFHHKGR